MDCSPPGPSVHGIFQARVLEWVAIAFYQNVPSVSLIFLKRSIVFPSLLFYSISLHRSLRKAFLSLFAILWNSAFKWVFLSFSSLPFSSLLFTAICKASSDDHFAFLYFFFLGMFLITASYTLSWTSIHSSSSTLFIRSNPLNLFVTSTMNKTSGGDGIPVELFQILKDDAVKVLHSISQQIWKTQQWPQDWKR